MNKWKNFFEILECLLGAFSRCEKKKENIKCTLNKRHNSELLL